MLEYFSKVKKHQEEKKQRQEAEPQPQLESESQQESSHAPVLTPNDELFLERMVSDEGTPPPLPERPMPPTAGEPQKDDLQLVLYDNSETDESDFELDEAVDETLGKCTSQGTPDLDKEFAKDKGGDDSTRDTAGNQSKSLEEQKKKNRWSLFQRAGTKKEKQSKAKSDEKPGKENQKVSQSELSKEEQDIAEVLDNLNLAAENNKVFSLSKESQALVQRFTVVLKDLVNGVPTAYDDLVRLLDDSQGQLQKAYKHLPPFMQKLIKSLPKKLTTTLAPELLATAAEAQGFASASADPGKKAKLSMPNLKDMVTKPGAVVGLLKAIMNVLKLRWPAFIGTNVLWSLGLFVLLFVFWYCHKRGREVRLAKEKAITDQEEEYLGGDEGGSSSRGPRVELEIEEIGHDGASSVGAERLPEGTDMNEPLVPKYHNYKISTGSKSNPGSSSNAPEPAVDEQARREARRQRQRQKWADAPSHAPLDSQESCIIS